MHLDVILISSPVVCLAFPWFLGSIHVTINYPWAAVILILATLNKQYYTDFIIFIFGFQWLWCISNSNIILILIRINGVTNVTSSVITRNLTSGMFCFCIMHAEVNACTHPLLDTLSTFKLNYITWATVWITLTFKYTIQIIIRIIQAKETSGWN